MTTKSTLLYSLLLLSLFSCKKDKDPDIACFPNTPTTRQLNNSAATVKLESGKYYIIEAGAIDTKLNPCELPDKFKVDNLSVFVTGNIKETAPVIGEPCCTENLEVTLITQ